jgi:hypothetical protein
MARHAGGSGHSAAQECRDGAGKVCKVELSIRTTFDIAQTASLMLGPDGRIDASRTGRVFRSHKRPLR